MNQKSHIEAVLKDITGAHHTVNKITPMGGGCINQAYRIETDRESFFIKCNSASQYPEMFYKEAKGIELLKQAKAIDTSTVIGAANYDGDSFLVLKYIDSGAKTHNFWTDFGTKLAKLHKHTNTYFGLNYHNYIGFLVQYNYQKDKWADFFIEERLLRQIKLARDSALIDTKTIKAFETFFKVIEDIFPSEAPALLHGDLWNGNYMVNEQGAAVLIDPAVYYGHREMDLAMTQLFGGFNEAFYVSYHQAFPLEKGWEDRWQYCNLYPLMVHLNLFGTGYLQSVKFALSKFL